VSHQSQLRLALRHRWEVNGSHGDIDDLAMEVVTRSLKAGEFSERARGPEYWQNVRHDVNRTLGRSLEILQLFVSLRSHAPMLA
jgi:hypothetical protein